MPCLNWIVCFNFIIKLPKSSSQVSELKQRSIFSFNIPFVQYSVKNRSVQSFISFIYQCRTIRDDCCQNLYISTGFEQLNCKNYSHWIPFIFKVRLQSWNYYSRNSGGCTLISYCWTTFINKTHKSTIHESKNKAFFIIMLLIGKHLR